jgi:hypothetical protein
VQAHLANVPPIFIAAGQHKPDTEGLPFRLSHAGYDYESLRQLGNAAMQGNLAPKANDGFADEIFLPPQGAAACIVHSLQELTVRRVLLRKEILPIRLMRIGLGMARHWLGSIVSTKGRESIRVRNRKMPGGIHGPEVRSVARKLGVEVGVSIRERDFNLVEIRPHQHRSSSE